MADYASLSVNFLVIMLCKITVFYKNMKRRLLYVIFSFLALFSSYAGIGVQRAVFSSSDDVKIVTVHAPSQEFVSASSSESKIIERVFSRSQKKADSCNKFSTGLFFDRIEAVSVYLPFFTYASFNASRVLLLPKSIQNIIFLQTVI